MLVLLVPLLHLHSFVAGTAYSAEQVQHDIKHTSYLRNVSTNLPKAASSRTKLRNTGKGSAKHLPSSAFARTNVFVGFPVFVLVLWLS